MIDDHFIQFKLLPPAQECFHRCLSVHSRGRGSGVPLLTRPWSLVPGPFPMEGKGKVRLPPSHVTGPVQSPVPGSVLAEPSQVLGQEYPLLPDRTTTGGTSFHTKQDHDRGISSPTNPRPRQDTHQTGYGAGGTPLAVTQ